MYDLDAGDIICLLANTYVQRSGIPFSLLTLKRVPNLSWFRSGYCLSSDFVVIVQYNSGLDVLSIPVVYTTLYSHLVDHTFSSKSFTSMYT